MAKRAEEGVEAAAAAAATAERSEELLNVDVAEGGAPGEELIFACAGAADAGAGAEDPDARFDAIVTALEAAILDPSFHDSVTDFCRANCADFDAPEGEFKLSYTPLFEAYTGLVEGKVMESLTRLVPGKPVDEEELAALLEARGGELAGDVFDVLVSMGDFEEFVSLMGSYRQQMDFEREGEGGGEGEDGSDARAGRGGEAGSSEASAAAASSPSSSSPSKRAALPSFVGLAPTVISLEKRLGGLALEEG